jgi:hypothetical protein
MLHISNTDTLKSIYFAYFHSIIKYGIIFWDNSFNSKKIFILKKKSVRIVAGVRSRNSCRGLFKRSKILPLPHEYTISLMNFNGNNQDFQTNTAAQKTSTIFIDQLPTTHVFRKVHTILASKFSTLYHLIKISKSLPSSVL